MSATSAPSRQEPLTALLDPSPQSPAIEISKATMRNVRQNLTAKSAKLPQGESVPVELTPTQPGRFGFACQMGMSRGTLEVE